MPQFTNGQAVPLSIAVFLATDYYDYIDEPNTFSATTLLKPLRQIILGSRLPTEDQAIDLTQLVANRMGVAIHNGVEQAWIQNHSNAMKLLGYPAGLIQRVIVNPPAGTDLTGKIPVYLEQRAKRSLRIGNDVFHITGKFDFVGEGRLEDVKTTSVWTAIRHSNDDYYTWQGSIYRWLNPDLITADEMAIQWLFTDWSKSQARSDPKYPKSRHVQRFFLLKGLAETERFLRSKLQEIQQHWNTEELALPPCSDVDLWRSEPIFKYYKNPEKTQRSTKNFETYQDAVIRLAADGGGGLIREVPGLVKACHYCPCYLHCTQKDQLIASGDLVVDQ